jgi:hypothetical protein
MAFESLPPSTLSQPNGVPMAPLSDPETAAPKPDTSAEDALLVGEVYRKFEARRALRRPYEVKWYVNASALGGYPDVRFNVDTEKIEIKKEPAHRKRYRINLIKPKYVARVAKYTKSPPNPTVIPATSDREDLMNARASQKALEYQTRKGQLRQRWMQAMQWVPITGKAFWWIRFDDQAQGLSPQMVTDDMGKSSLQQTSGEVKVDFGSAFEFLPADPGIELLGDQPEIMRARMVKLDDLKSNAEFADQLEGVEGESRDTDIFFYQRQIADIGTRLQGLASRQNVDEDDPKPYVLRIETFTKPCAEYPQGRYLVVAAHKLLRKQDSLPGEFASLCPNNPYPVVEFCDDAAPGQFWPDAFVERCVGLNSEYNEYRSKFGENLALHFFPKLMVWNQLGLDSESYNNEGGERLNMNYIPGIPPPMFLQPANVVGDAWNAIQSIKKELDDVTMIHPPSMGSQQGTNSGYQVSLLQEAGDAVHGPAIQRNAMALEEAYNKIRHLMKLYDTPRLITIAGKNNMPEMVEFKSASVDENAEIIVEPDTMMPPLRTARLDMIRMMAKDGLFGNIQDPKVLKRVNDMIRMGGYAEFEIDQDQRDREQAQHENLLMERGEQLAKPMPWENHLQHWEDHTDLFKSPQAQLWQDEQWRRNIWHGLVHLNYINPQEAMMMAAEFNLQNELAKFQQLHNMQQQQAQMLMGPPPQAGPAPGGPGPPPMPGGGGSMPPGAPPPGPPQPA